MYVYYISMQSKSVTIHVASFANTSRNHTCKEDSDNNSITISTNNQN